MRTILKNIRAAVLASLARAIVRRFRPQVVMVTGSVGKTSTKDAVAAVLSSAYFMRKSDKGFNSEIGVPLTIIGAKNPWSNPIAWLGVLVQGLAAVYLPTIYPKLLVLEVGADKPGDLEGIMKIVQPHATVVTFLPAIPVHVEAYADPEAVRKEEFVPAAALPQGAPLVVSADDPYALELASHTSTALRTFGYSESADVRITDLAIAQENDTPIGMSAVLQVQGKSYPVQVPGAFGRSQLYAPAAAVAMALSFDMTAEEAVQGLRAYTPPPGRGRIFAGIKDSMLIDDSYNASPPAVEESLRSLVLLPRETRKVAILGDMLELGRYSVAEHERIGRLVQDHANVLVTVGARSHSIATAAKAAGMSVDSIHIFETSKEAAQEITTLINEGDVVLIKGSQGVRMERIARVLLKDSESYVGLVRQDDEWKHR